MPGLCVQIMEEAFDNGMYGLCVQIMEELYSELDAAKGLKFPPRSYKETTDV